MVFVSSVQMAQNDYSNIGVQPQSHPQTNSGVNPSPSESLEPPKADSSQCAVLGTCG